MNFFANNVLTAYKYSRITCTTMNARKTKRSVNTEEKRPLVTFQATEENYEFLTASREKQGTPYAFHVNKALDIYRKEKAA